MSVRCHVEGHQQLASSRYSCQGTLEYFRHNTTIYRVTNL